MANVNKNYDTYYERWQAEKGYKVIPAIGEIPDEQLEESGLEILEREAEFIEDQNMEVEA